MLPVFHPRLPPLVRLLFPPCSSAPEPVRRAGGRRRGPYDRDPGPVDGGLALRAHPGGPAHRARGDGRHQREPSEGPPRAQAVPAGEPVQRQQQPAAAAGAAQPPHLHGAEREVGRHAGVVEAWPQPLVQNRQARRVGRSIAGGTGTLVTGAVLGNAVFVNAVFAGAVLVGAVFDGAVLCTTVRRPSPPQVLVGDDPAAAPPPYGRPSQAQPEPARGRGEHALPQAQTLGTAQPVEPARPQVHPGQRERVRVQAVERGHAQPAGAPGDGRQPGEPRVPQIDIGVGQPCGEPPEDGRRAQHHTAPAGVDVQRRAGPHARERQAPHDPHRAEVGRPLEACALKLGARPAVRAAEGDGPVEPGAAEAGVPVEDGRVERGESVELRSLERRLLE
ncbi:pentapeptide repeat-containing protein [Microbispora bryophytorum]|uniref:pentapeptide repeat-containing protein n=1 Tax=Microbispora bryophytorum TaxID=1460882 RepID=UPI00371284D2